MYDRDSIVVQIIHPTGVVEIPYIWLEDYINGFKTKRSRTTWLRKVIKFAAENGGWKIIQK